MPYSIYNIIESNLTSILCIPEKINSSLKIVPLNELIISIIIFDIVIHVSTNNNENEGDKLSILVNMKGQINLDDVNNF